MGTLLKIQAWLQVTWAVALLWWVMTLNYSLRAHRPTTEQESPRALPTCTPPTSIYFVKVYKTGSTTMYNLLARYALNRGLRWVSYNTRPHENNIKVTPIPNAMVERIVPHYVPGQHQKYNILADHSIYDEGSVAAILEQPVSYVTFLRNPVSQARSFIIQLSPLTAKMAKTQFRDPLKLMLEKHNNMVKVGKKHKHFKRFSNIAARQLGFPGDLQNLDKADFQEHLQKIQSQFVVGLTEHYTLSILLMRRKLCLNWEDVIFIPIRRTEYKMDIPMMKTEDLTKEICQLSPLDCYLYDHFNRSFWDCVRSEGTDLTRETEAFEDTLERVYNYCSSIHSVIKATRTKGHFKVIWKRKNLTVAKSEWSESFEVTPKMCAAMRLEERAFGSYFYFRQNFEKCQGYWQGKCPIYDGNIRHLNCAALCQRSESPEDLLDALLNDKGGYIWH